MKDVKEVVVAYFKEFLLRLTGETEESHEIQRQEAGLLNEI
jgi:hypothetical protein